jgi:hypothetical protein
MKTALANLQSLVDQFGDDDDSLALSVIRAALAELKPSPNTGYKYADAHAAFVSEFCSTSGGFVGIGQEDAFNKGFKAARLITLNVDGDDIMSDTVKKCPVCGYYFWESVGCPNGCKTAVDSGSAKNTHQQAVQLLIDIKELFDKAGYIMMTKDSEMYRRTDVVLKQLRAGLNG